MTSIQATYGPPLRDLIAAAKANACPVILVQDTKSGDLSRVTTEGEGCRVISMEEQLGPGFAFADLAQALPTQSYSRKNLGYLIAWSLGVGWTAETDDDNVPSPAFFEAPEAAFHRVLGGRQWVNPYRVFTTTDVWPRGLPLRQLEHRHESNIQPAPEPLDVALIQAIADEDPDVDAIYRLTRELPVRFSSGDPCAIELNVLAPVNSQATWWRRDIGRLMYFPSTMSWRAADIWRGVVAQLVLHRQGAHLGYVGPLVRQVRNPHDLFVDFVEEVPCYVHTDDVAAIAAQELNALGPGRLSDALVKVYTGLCRERLASADELPLLEVWNLACDQIGLP